MRKLILIASLVLMSAAAQAGQTRGLIVASNEPATSTVAEQLKTIEKAPVAEPKKDVKAEIKTETKPTAEKPAVKKRETDEQKARRIAARYGISW